MTHTELAERFIGCREFDFTGIARMRLSEKQANWLASLIRQAKIERRHSRSIDYNNSVIYQWTAPEFEYNFNFSNRMLSKTNKAVYATVVLGM